MSDPDHAGVEEVPGPSDDRSDGPSTAKAPGRARRRNVIAAALAVVLVVAVVLAVVSYRAHTADERKDTNREDALAAARQFALRMDNFDGAKVDKYIASVRKLLTTKAKGDFDKTFTAFKEVYKKGHAKGTGKIWVAGVGNIDHDSATVLVVHDATVKSDLGTQARNFRWTVDMAKVRGTWLVNDFNPVN